MKSFIEDPYDLDDQQLKELNQFSEYRYPVFLTLGVVGFLAFAMLYFEVSGSNSTENKTQLASRIGEYITGALAVGGIVGGYGLVSRFRHSSDALRHNDEN